MVAGQPECGLRQLSIGLSVRPPVHPDGKNAIHDDNTPRITVPPRATGRDIAVGKTAATRLE